MSQEKRLRRPPKPLIIEDALFSKKTRKSKIKIKPKRCAYQIIAFPSKFISPNKVFTVYGNIPFLETNDDLASEPSLLNRFFRCEEVTSTNIVGQKLLHIKLTKKKGIKTLQWNQIIETFEESKNEKLLEWSDLIKTFCQRTEELIQTGDIREYQNLESSIKRSQEEFEKEKLRLLENNPCIYIKTYAVNKKNESLELIFNSQLIKELGYSIDAFASTVIQDGIPQIMPYDDDANSELLKTLLENYFVVRDQSYRTSKLSSYLYTKDSHIRDITLQAHFFPFNLGEKVGVDIIVSISDIGRTYNEEEKLPKGRINKNYHKKILASKRESDDFITNYYSELELFRKVDQNRVCRVKDLDPVTEHDFQAKIEAVKEEKI